MRRAGSLWPLVASFENLRRAALRAARGKRDRSTIARFLERLEPELLGLLRDLEQGTYQPGEPVRFTIRDPKERVISAAPFRDRVLHHAFIGPLEPVFERRMRPESFACRRGKGTHAALARARTLVRGHERFLKLDIERCFDSIRHDVVIETLERIVKDRRVLWLARTILRGPSSAAPTGVGLPIGSLTSQWFANLVLDRLDHFVTEELRCGAYVRYMDDFALFGDEKPRLRELLDHVRTFVEGRLRLRLKERANILAPVSEGLPFLGFRLYRGTVRVRPESLRRSKRRLAARVRACEHGEINEDRLAGCVRSIITRLASADTWNLRRNWFAGA
ncbi:MAG: group II intron reverse transcriptase domain-containing protein [Planctomycetes bacterium]|nr:group II intron reverse transcriptase domain-containing protein [Planctomycetota bacterium]